MIGVLTDDVIRTDPSYMRVIDRSRELLDEMGWGDAPLVDQYAVATTLNLAAENDD